MGKYGAACNRATSDSGVGGVSARPIYLRDLGIVGEPVRMDDSSRGGVFSGPGLGLALFVRKEATQSNLSSLSKSISSFSLNRIFNLAQVSKQKRPHAHAEIPAGSGD